METADALERHPANSRAGGSAIGDQRNALRPKPVADVKKGKKRRAFWLKQLHTWHWVSAAVSLIGMLLFSVTGITLNHAASIGAEPVVTQNEGRLPQSLLARLPAAGGSTAPLPPEVAEAVAQAVHLDPTGRAADWSGEDEVYVAMPGPGRDAWVSIDRTTGDVQSESTDRGWISYLNDLHKGRNTGGAWSWFIDIFAGACLLFTITGLFLLQLHARHRPTTWPLVGLSLLVPLLLALFFIH
ncbi:hypothetical protein SAMN06296065_10845 [Novosphingobium panipatense]|uniref:PepSY-associated transmembrane protein n=1 Tax=Novosphingobium panipatense TaxID=428991 RepID=A0ABY1QPX6_9SPHN|nr:hypothetical protein SAMN06296065_10845 [Novosphingobium panipatense]